MTYDDMNGVTEIPNALIDDMTLTRAEKLVMLSLLRRYDIELRCSCPALQDIALDASMSRTTVKQALKSLVEKGHIRAERNPGYTTQYEILTPGFKPLEV